MSKLSDLGPAPYLGYTASMVERAAELRTDGLALAELQNRGDARAYVVRTAKVLEDYANRLDAAVEMAKVPQ